MIILLLCIVNKKFKFVNKINRHIKKIQKMDKFFIIQGRSTVDREVNPSLKELLLSLKSFSMDRLMRKTNH